jgi:hypothetical protein
MYCPSCKAEYRQGFTHCSDCDVDLVETLDALPKTSENVEPVALLWTGTDSQMQGAIGDELDDANIAFHRQFRDVGPLPGLPEAVYAIFVHPRDLDAAKTVLDDIHRRLEVGEPPEGENDASALDESDSDETAPDDIAHDFHPDDATEEVWSGTGSDMAETVRICLRENGIGCVVEDRGANHAVLVAPPSEARAKEIVDQIVRGTPGS